MNLSVNRRFHPIDIRWIVNVYFAGFKLDFDASARAFAQQMPGSGISLQSHQAGKLMARKDRWNSRYASIPRSNDRPPVRSFVGLHQSG